MENGHIYDHFRSQVQPALQSKLDEFRLLGYERITEKELWGFLTNKKWKKANENIRLFEIVDDILALKVGDFINYATIEAFKGSDFDFDNEEDRKELLK